MAAKRPRQSKIPNNSEVSGYTNSYKHVHWTLEERNAFAEGIKKYGTVDIKKIADFIGTRSVDDVNTKLYWHKYRYGESSKALPTDTTQAPNVGDWFELARNVFDLHSRTQDYSACLANVMESLADSEEGDSNEEVDFGQIYRYFQNVLSGAVPPIPGPTESLIIINLVKELSQVFKQNSFEEEKELLKNLDKRPIMPVPEEFRNVIRYVKTPTKKYKRKNQQNDTAPSKQPSATSNQSSEATANTTSETISEPTPCSSRADNSDEANALQADAQFSEYPAYNIRQHTFRMAAYGLNPLQIPAKFLEKSRDFVNTL